MGILNRGKLIPINEGGVKGFTQQATFELTLDGLKLIA